MPYQLIFLIGLFLGIIFGFISAALITVNKIEETWHDGYRAGKYKNNDNL